MPHQKTFWASTSPESRATVVADAEIACAVLPAVERTLELYSACRGPDRTLCCRVATRVMELVADEAETGWEIDGDEWVRTEEIVERIARQVLSALKEPDAALN